MKTLHDAFAALMPRVEAIAAAHHRRNWKPGRPTLADTRQQAALILWRNMVEAKSENPIDHLSRDLRDWFRHETHYRSRIEVQVVAEMPVAVTRLTPLDLAAASDLESVIESRISALPARHRYVVRQRAAGAKIRTIAEDLNITPGRVSQMFLAARSQVGVS
jgi:hypothetical protein